MQECGTFTIANAIEDILSSSSMRYISCNRMRGVFLIFVKARELLVNEDVPS